MTFKIFFALLVVLSANLSFAKTLETLFEENFYSLHVPSRCGQNILNFLKLAQAENFDLSRAEIINVQNGWVEPLYVRNGGHSPKLPGPAGLVHQPAARYFDFHIFLIVDGRVFDFDYGNRPVVPDVKTYFKKMWLTGKERDRFLGLKIYKARDYLSGKSMPENIPVINLVKFSQERARD